MRYILHRLEHVKHMNYNYIFKLFFKVFGPVKISHTSYHGDLIFPFPRDASFLKNLHKYRSENDLYRLSQEQAKMQC